ncbi:MAG: transposase [candidate division NC10 bacterium]|nr:transposase [candidate division NC10 bacterium]
MPRHARLDAPGTLHHVIIRGLERGAIVKDDVDRAAFVTRLGAMAQATGTSIYAWVLLRNHAHILLRSGPAGLPRFMRRLLTGYAITFNRRHKRVGHLFQNRYKSIVCEEDAYFRELVRYIHLNPLRAKLVPDVRALDRYPWCGHATVVGRIPRAWQDRRTVLGWFGQTEGRAVRAYRDYVREGILVGRCPELVGGGLVRSAGGWAEVRALRRQKEPMGGDPRILGSDDFAAGLLRDAEERQAAALRRAPTPQETEAVMATICKRAGASVEELNSGGRRGPLSAVRADLARRLVAGLGLSLAQAARHLGVSTAAISKILRKTEA